MSEFVSVIFASLKGRIVAHSAGMGLFLKDIPTFEGAK